MKAAALASASNPLLSTPRKKGPRTFDNPLTPSEKLPMAFPITPASSVADTPRPQTPETPRNSAVPQTPTSRRAALYERIRLRSLTTPTKTPRLDREGAGASNGKQTPSKPVGQDELRRRCLLGRIPAIAEAVWMYVLFINTSLLHFDVLAPRLFAAPSHGASSNPTPATRRRRAVPFDEVVGIVIKSSKTPVSEGKHSCLYHRISSN